VTAGGIILLCFAAILSGNGMLVGCAAVAAVLWLLLIHDDNPLDNRGRRS
jgi:hypothetical protein